MDESVAYQENSAFKAKICNVSSLGGVPETGIVLHVHLKLG